MNVSVAYMENAAFIAYVLIIKLLSLVRMSLVCAINVVLIVFCH